LQDRFGLSVGMLGWIDTGYLAAYAVGQFLSGVSAIASGPAS
jgi:sugar phosphate permease